MTIELRFNSLDDFRPERVASQVAPLRNFLRERGDKQTHGQGTASEAGTAETDSLLIRQLNSILHAPEFQKLEAAWRGLHYLVSRSQTGLLLKIRVLNVSQEELRQDFDQARTFDQSAFFKKVHEEVVGGPLLSVAPFGALIGDYEFDHGLQDMALLKKLAQVAAAAHAPLIAGASPRLFQLSSFSELSVPRTLPEIFDSGEYAHWQAFQESGDARYVGLCVPRILLRLPYGPELVPVEEFAFTEEVSGKDHSEYLWGNASCAMAVCLINAFATYGWCAAVTGIDGGGLVAGLPIHAGRTEEGEAALRGPVEIFLTDRREEELTKLGFLPLVHCKGTEYAAFFSAPSVQKARRFGDEAVDVTARFSTQLPYTLVVSRFAHYLRAIAQETLGRLSRLDCEQLLNRWLKTYVTQDDNASPAMKARYPLRDAWVEVAEDGENTGRYKAVAFLRPHFQLKVPPLPLTVVVQI